MPRMYGNNERIPLIMLTILAVLVAILAMFIHPGQAEASSQLPEVILSSMFFGVALLTLIIQYAVVLIKEHIDSKFYHFKPQITLEAEITNQVDKVKEDTLTKLNS